MDDETFTGSGAPPEQPERIRVKAKGNNVFGLDDGEVGEIDHDQEAALGLEMGIIERVGTARRRRSSR